jgi:hypothetical protein
MAEINSFKDRYILPIPIQSDSNLKGKIITLYMLFFNVFLWLIKPGEERKDYFAKSGVA